MHTLASGYKHLFPCYVSRKKFLATSRKRIHSPNSIIRRGCIILIV